jgi:hypothetical protein
MDEIPLPVRSGTIKPHHCHRSQTGNGVAIRHSLSPVSFFSSIDGFRLSFIFFCDLFMIYVERKGLKYHFWR